ncbi:hypothetical protein [Thiolinea disciformis]|uniref:hypothetical protein n=1 Tax=Thiolinea disciformis TaxID=125614 RepID=UPI000364D6C3|nr:hypothetical protein [Thiolinea disciformis]
MIEVVTIFRDEENMERVIDCISIRKRFLDQEKDNPDENWGSLRTIWLNSDRTVFLDETFEIDELGRHLSSVYLDKFHQVIGTLEYIYVDNSFNYVSRLEKDERGQELDRIDYFYDAEGSLERSIISSHGRKILWGTYNKETMLTDWHDEKGDSAKQVGDIGYQPNDGRETIFSYAKKRHDALNVNQLYDKSPKK